MSKFRCPECGQETTAYSTRARTEGREFRCRRVCPAGHRFTTVETWVGSSLRTTVNLGLVEGAKSLLKDSS